MHKGPNGELRPTDPIANAVHVAKIATGERTDITKLAKNCKQTDSKIGENKSVPTRK